MNKEVVNMKCDHEVVVCGNCSQVLDINKLIDELEVKDYEINVLNCCNKRLESYNREVMEKYNKAVEENETLRKCLKEVL